MTERRFKDISAGIEVLTRLHRDTSGIKDEGRLFAGLNTNNVFGLSEGIIELETQFGWLTKEEADNLYKQINEARKS